MPRILRLALLALLAAALLPACRGQVSSEPPIHPNWNMDQVNRIDPQEPSDLFEDGRGMRTYVEGTVRSANLAGAANPCTLPESNPELCEGTDASGEWINGLPAGVKLNAALLDRGQARYDIFCSPCHDRAATGDGMVARRGMTPPTLHNDFQRQKPIGQVYGAIKNGGPIMPPYAVQIPVEDRWAIAAYVRALQISQAPPAGLAKGN
jgi:mono/diheme cytochrome c family protein